MEKLTIVLAGNYSQFDRFLNEHVPKKYRNKYVFADRPEKLAGIIADRIIYIGTFRDLKNSYEMEKLAESRIR